VFLDFFYNLRSHGVPATTHNWLSLLDALRQGLHEDSLDGFYQVARCLLVSNESEYDAFDQAFLETFRGVETDARELLAEIDAWLADPHKLAYIDPALRAALETMDLEELRRQLLDRLARQKERHDGGSHWIGTGGTSPFGQGGYHPSGIRIGGHGGGRSALAVADARRFHEYRRDLVLDTRQMAAALRRLRRMGRSGLEEELDLDETIDQTARNCGDLEIVMRPPRKNDLRVLLLMDVGGSMDPHARVVSQLFSAASQGGGFKEFRYYYFHNCVYGKVYEDARFYNPVPTTELLRTLEPTWRLILVGDAYMHPGELMMSTGSLWENQRGPMGYTWLARLAARFPRAAWLNPEPERIWGAPTISEIRRLFAMFPLSLDGLDKMVEHLGRLPSPAHWALVHRIAKDIE